jgi:hypothetical protein
MLERARKSIAAAQALLRFKLFQKPRRAASQRLQYLVWRKN